MKLPTRLKAEERKISKYHGSSRNQIRIMNIYKWICHSKQENTLFLTISVIEKGQNEVESESRSIVSDSVTPWTAMEFSRPKSGVDSLSLLQGIFPTQNEVEL